MGITAVFESATFLLHFIDDRLSAALESLIELFYGDGRQFIFIWWIANR
jgi:hypothetical protein